MVKRNVESLTEKDQGKSNKYTITAYKICWILFICFVIGVTVSTILTPHPLHYVDEAPDGWYRQRSYIYHTHISDNGTKIFFSLCQEYSSGPLHGFFKVADNVVFFDEGRYDIKIVNNTIVEAYRYE